MSHTVSIISLGCAKNLVDSEVMLGKLIEKGFVVAPDLEAAELILVNTCGFLQSAVEEAIDKILAAAEYKKTGVCKKLVVAGCLVERYRKKLAQELPEVDAFLSVDEILKIDFDLQTSKEVWDTERLASFLYDDAMPRVLSSGGHLAHLKIAEGCNRPCAFCIIPKIRGRYRSRDLTSVLREFNNLIMSGVKEIDLIAQDTTNYGRDLEGGKFSIHTVFDEISKINASHDFWVRLMYAYPLGIDERLIKQLRDEPRICNYLDLPLQHISDKLLKSMCRPLGAAGTRELVSNIKRWNPELALRTSLIVGFPGETQADVDLLEDFIAEGHFEQLGVFVYSPEEEAKAFKLGNDLSEKTKQERLKRLMLAQKKVVKQKLSNRLGTRQKVLVEGIHPETNLLLVGRSEWQAPEVDGVVLINEVEDAEQSSVVSTDNVLDVSKYYNRFVEVEITETKGYDLIGKVKRILT
ncbi:MAG: 30S ribosomal protein S12 methylthiotransferase RimO [Deltaproteobacteria bacterium]|jgi:ribosomal protein S12 methylthiotransferase|nr:30S ribosomal protein S12 methylthiotransferase RimO [Deltaproteobacteria bacterium]